MHACWHAPSVERLPEDGQVAELGKHWAWEIHNDQKSRGLWAKEKAERAEFADLKRLDVEPTRDLPNHALAAQERQADHPIKVLTSGREERVPFEKIFFVGGKWRFVRRFDWWNDYEEEPAVVVGHYWRRRANAWVEGKPDPWHTEAFHDWTGPHRNVFCVDYSVGRRFMERARGKADNFEGGLAALRWPERELVFSDREGTVPTRCRCRRFRLTMCFSSCSGIVPLSKNARSLWRCCLPRIFSSSICALRCGPQSRHLCRCLGI